MSKKLIIPSKRKTNDEPHSVFASGRQAAAVVPVSPFGPGGLAQAHSLSAFGSGGQAAAAVGSFSSGELKEDDVTRLLNGCFDVQKQIYKIKEFMFQFCKAIEREKKQNDQTKGNTDGDVGTRTVSDCIQQAISMMSVTDGEIIKLQEMVSKMSGEPKNPSLISLINHASKFFDSLMRRSENRDRRFLQDCVTGVTKLTAILGYASDSCEHFLAKQKQIQAEQERKARTDSKSSEEHAAAQHEIHASVLIVGQDGLGNTRELLEQYMVPCSDDDDTDWMTTSSSSLSASAQSSRFSCESKISVTEVVELYDETCMLLQITSDLQALSAALLMTDDIDRSDELKYKTHLVDRIISGLTKFNAKSRKDTRKINGNASYWLREPNPKNISKALERNPGDDESDESYATSSSGSVASWGSAVSNPVDETENMALRLDMLIPAERLVVNIERADEKEKFKKERLSMVFKQIKAPKFDAAATAGFLSILQNLVAQGKVYGPPGDEIKPLKLLIESDGTKTVGLSERFMDAKAQKATRFNVRLSWLREYVLRLKVDGMHDAQRAISGGASSGGDEEEVSCFFKIYSKLNKTSAENMADRISDQDEKTEFTASPFFSILQDPRSQFETHALRAMEERVLERSQKKTVATITKDEFNREGNGRLCIDNASTLDMMVIGAERLGMFSTLLDGGASNDCEHWIFGPRNCIYHAEANNTSLMLHMCEIVTFKNGVYCINICIEITERRPGSSSREHRYRTIHTLPLCDVTGQFKETFTPIELNKVCVLWNGMIDDVANGLMQHNALKMLGPNMLKAVGDETQLWDTLISVFLKNGGLLPYYLHTKDDTDWRSYNQFVTTFNEYILGNQLSPTSSDGENGLIQLFMTIAEQIDPGNGTRCIKFIHGQCVRIILASNDRLNHAGTAHYHLGTMNCPTVLGHLQHTTKYENPHWKSLLTCCGARVLAADASSKTGIVIRVCVPSALGVTPTRRTGLGFDPDVQRSADESSVASGSNSSSIVSRGESVNLKLLEHFPIHRVYASQHAQIIANRYRNRSGLSDIKEIENVLTNVDELFPNPVFSALEIHRDDNGFHSVSGVNDSQFLGSQILTPEHVDFFNDQEPVEGQGPDQGQGPVKPDGQMFGGSTKQFKNKSMKRKRSNSKKFPTKKKRQSKKKNTIKKRNNNVNIKHKNKTKKNKKNNIR